MFQQMTTFVRIADMGSISRAARSLGLSVAMASRHLGWLEKELGIALMRRTTRRIDLTDEGGEFLARARVLLAGVEDAKQVVRPGRGAAGRVVLSVPVAFGLGRLAPLLLGLLDAHPRLHVDLRLEDRAVDLLADGVDIAVRAGATPPDSASIVARRLGAYARALCASPKFLAKHGPITSVAALASVPCVLHGTGPTAWTFETPTGPESVFVDGRMRTNNLLVVRHAVLQGAGIGWLPHWLVAEDLRKRRLVRVLEGAVQPSIEIFGLFHKQARGAGAIRAVLDYFTEALRREDERG